jgi:glycosyltransferase involved in cell wall biosynthesis
VLIAGTLEPRKGLDVVVEAAGRMPRSNDDQELKFVFAGRPGHASNSLIEQGRRLSNCHFLGYVDDAELINLYRSAEALLLPSVYEGFGLTALEAMACGTPVVAGADSGGPTELFAGTAVVAKSRTAEAWLDAIKEAETRRDELQPAGLATAARFEWSKAAARTLEVLKSAAGRNRADR